MNEEHKILNFFSENSNTGQSKDRAIDDYESDVDIYHLKKRPKTDKNGLKQIKTA